MAEMDSRDGVRVIACPAQADQTAGVVDDQHDPVEPDLVAEAFDELDMVFEGAGQVGRRISEAGEIRRHRSTSHRGERGKQMTPHIRALRPPVHAQHRQAIRHLCGLRLPVGDPAHALERHLRHALTLSAPPEGTGRDAG